MKKIICYLLLIFLILFHYREVLNLPFIMDDWGWIELFYFNNPSNVIRHIFILNHKIFYRPLAQFYFYGLFLIFDLNPLPAHIAALLIHFVNTCLLIKIAEGFFSNRQMALSCGLLYASAFTIHLGTLSWIVGIYELGSICFFLISFFLFTKDRKCLSGVMFMLGLLFKEAIIVLPFIIVLYHLYQNPIRPFYKNLLKEIHVHLLVMIVYFAFRLGGIFLIELPESHSYSIGFIGKHLINNGRLYLVWMVQSIFPYHIPFLGFIKTLINMVFVLLFITICFYAIRYIVRNRMYNDFKLPLFFICWICIGLLPVIFFKSHIYRYYLTVSLFGFILFTVDVINKILNWIFSKYSFKKISFNILIGLLLFSLIIKSQLFQMEHPSVTNLYAGTNQQKNTAKEINLVRDGLQRYHEVLPDSTVIVLRGVNVWNFSKNSGIRIWYRNSSLEVFDKCFITKDSTGLYLEEHLERNKIDVKKRRLNPENTIFYQRIGDHLRLDSIPVNH